MNAAKYLQQNVEARTIYTLPKGLEATTVARACRDAFLAFCNKAPRWGKRDLAMWLMGPYANVTKEARCLVPEHSYRPSGVVTVDPMHLAQVLRAHGRCAAHMKKRIEVEWPDGEHHVYASTLSEPIAPRELPEEPGSCTRIKIRR